jgi:polyvinyl alcohol dehydrogenase (cytochrome)
MGYDERSRYHNPAETRITPANAATLRSKWVFTLAGYPPGSPAIAEDTVFVLATGGLYAIDLETGMQRWARPEIAGTSSVAYHDGAIYVHSQRADLYRLNASDGTTVWGPTRTYDNAQADGTSSPIVAGGLVMVGHSAEAAEIDSSGMLEADRKAARGGVFAADIETGQMAWRYDTVPPGGAGENGAMVWSSVAVDVGAGMVYATTGNNWDVGGPNSDAFHAIALATGAGMWKKQVRAGDVWSLMIGGTGQDTDFGANPIVAEKDGRKMVAGGDKGSVFWALDPMSGEILWQREGLSAAHNPATGGVLNNGAFDGNAFYVVANETPMGSWLHALDPRTGDDLWPAKMFMETAWGMPTVANGVLFVPINATLHVLNAATGAVLTMFDTGGTIAAGGAAIAKGHVVVGSGLQYPFAFNALNNNEVHCYALP